MEKIGQGNEKVDRKWEEYLEHLAILISNLRMAYDMDIILGGDVGGYLSDYMIPLGQKVMIYNGFDRDVSYLKNCSYKKEASGYCNYRYMHAFYGRIGVKPFGKKRAATDKDFDFKWS